MDLIVDPYTDSAKGNIRISEHSYWDIAVRHATSFVIARISTPPPDAQM